MHGQMGIPTMSSMKATTSILESMYDYEDPRDLEYVANSWSRLR